jgi:hypothetical protein
LVGIVVNCSPREIVNRQNWCEIKRDQILKIKKGPLTKPTSHNAVQSNCPFRVNMRQTGMFASRPGSPQ